MSWRGDGYGSGGGHGSSGGYRYGGDRLSKDPHKVGTDKSRYGAYKYINSQRAPEVVVDLLDKKDDKNDLLYTVSAVPVKKEHHDFMEQELLPVLRAGSVPRPTERTVWMQCTPY